MDSNTVLTPIAGARLPVLRVAKGVVAAALVVACVALGAAVVPRAFGYDTVVVMSGSMGRAAPTGSLVLAQPKPAAAVVVGDVIVAENAGHAPVMHRVITLTRRGRDIVARTKGDANPAADPEPRILGASVLMEAHAIPYLGYLVGALKTPLVWLLVIALPATLIAVLTLRDIWLPEERRRRPQLRLPSLPRLRKLRGAAPAASETRLDALEQAQEQFGANMAKLDQFGERLLAELAGKREGHEARLATLEQAQQRFGANMARLDQFGERLLAELAAKREEHAARIAALEAALAPPPPPPIQGEQSHPS